MKRITCALLVLLILGSCKTICFVPNGINSIYLIKQRNEVTVFDYKNKNQHTENELWDFSRSILDHKINVDNKSGKFIYTFKDESIYNDTLYFSDTLLRFKLRLMPIFYSNDLFIFNNGINLSTSDKYPCFMVKYKSDSLISFNNKPKMQVFIFDYYAFNYGEKIKGYTQPISIFVSKDSGMIIGMSYYCLDQCNLYYRDTTPSLKTVQIIDYNKVFCSKKRLRKFLM